MNERDVIFSIGDMLFEYDEQKNEENIKKHGISFPVAARVFFDYNRIEMYDEDNSSEEDRYDTIGSVYQSIGDITIGTVQDTTSDILFVVYTERIRRENNGTNVDVTRIISARYATNFERGLYYGKYE